VYVLDEGLGRIIKLSATGTIDRRWGRGGIFAARYLQGAAGIAVDRNDRVYVTDFGGNRIVRVSANGRSAAVWPASQLVPPLINPAGIAIGAQDTVFVADQANGRVQVFSSGGARRMLWRVIERAKPDQQLLFQATPLGIAVGAGNRLHLTDALNRRVMEFSASGRLVSSSTDHFRTPVGVASGPGETAYVADAARNSVDLISSQGQVVRSIHDADGKNFIRPSGVTVDRSGDLLISDTGNNRIVRLPADSLH
jgi:DNA-binding beta-propeller fold protein YncE